MYLDEFYWLSLLLCVDGCQESVQHVSEYIRLPLEQYFPARNDNKLLVVNNICTKSSSTVNELKPIMHCLDQSHSSWS